MSSEFYDVAVVGGGIQGVGVAQAAAACGYRTLLLERTALAAATSSRSSKLIHGGLRYLESGQFGLVRKALRERSILLRNAPELVRMQPFYIPVYRDSSRGSWRIRAGLSLYALLGGLKAKARFHALSRSVWPTLDGLKQEGLQAVFRYRDAQTDDVALTQAVMRSAQSLGAELQCPARFVRASAGSEAVDVVYQDTVGRERQIHSRILVNAAGPWVGQVLNAVSPAARQLPFELVQGTHILVDEPAPQGIFYVEASQDRRVIFIMPWQGKTLVGTTETHYVGDPAEVKPLDEEIEYLRSIYRYYFPRAEARIEHGFTGLRVLPEARGGSLFHRPRDTIIDISLPRVISLYGGKLTGYRATAQQVVKKAQVWLPMAECKDTAGLRLQPLTG